MAVATNPTDWVHHETINDSAWTEITITNRCKWLTVRQLGSEAVLLPFEVKFRTDGAEDPEYFAADGVLVKGVSYASAIGGSNIFQPGDTVGYFQRVTGSGNMEMVVTEHEF